LNQSKIKEIGGFKEQEDKGIKILHYLNAVEPVMVLIKEKEWY